MNAIDLAVQTVLEGPEGAHIGAFFDYDGTLIDGYSAAAYLGDRIKRRDMGVRELLETLQLTLRGDLSEREFAEVIGKGVLDWAGRSEDEMRQLWTRLFAEQISPTMFPEAWRLVQAHRRMGHTLVIASSATPYQIEPLATEYEIPHLLCTRPLLRNGRLTGGIDGTPPWGEGKAAAVREFARQHRIDLTRSHGYANGNEDIPFLQSLGKPCAVQAKERLRQTALSQGWPLLSFEPRRRAPLASVARTVGAYAAMGTTFLAGLGYAKATGKTRRAVDFIAATSSDAALAILGVDVEVHGEEHLWTQRPCVFIINHQSKFDMFLMMYLVRRGFTGVAKQEAAATPGFGTFLKMADMAFLDRSNPQKAIDALRPAVERLQQGLSVVMAPEGTRSYSPRVGRFKKGAFHMAQQARVPVVPVVIRNAAEVMGRNAQVMRPGTVQIAVLPPIDVNEWQPQEFDSRIAAIRQRFVDTLECWPTDAPVAPTSA